MRREYEKQTAKVIPFCTEFEDGQIAWVLKQDILENGEIGIFSLNGEAYIKKLQDDKNGVFQIED